MKKLLAALAITALATMGTAQAIPYTDSWSASADNVASNLGLGNPGNPFTLAAVSTLNPGVGATTSGASGPAYTNGLTVVFAPSAIGVPPTVAEVVTFGTFTFTGTGVLNFQTSGFVNETFTGSVVDSTSVYNNQIGVLTLTWTKGSSTAPISFAASFSTNPNLREVPEPASLALLGAGLLGLGMVRRRQV